MLTKRLNNDIIILLLVSGRGGMADALVLGASTIGVRVQVPSPAPSKKELVRFFNQLFVFLYEILFKIQDCEI